MRFLIDAAVSWRLARLLADAGHDAVHVDRLQLAAAEDAIIFERARSEDRVIVTQDIDFQILLLASGRSRPSIVLFRTKDGRAASRCRLILEHLPTIEQDLERGAIVAFDEFSIRIHRLNTPSGGPDSTILPRQAD